MLFRSGHFEGVGEAVVDKHTAGQWEDLGLVLKTAERGREYQTVVVAFELCAVVVTLWVTVFLTQAFVGNQLLPIHHN